MEEDGTFFINSSLSMHAYGTGHNLREAVHDFKLVMAELYYDALKEEKNNYKECGAWIEDDYKHLLINLRMHL
jgi:hypothetical protein